MYEKTVQIRDRGHWIQVHVTGFQVDKSTTNKNLEQGSSLIIVEYDYSRKSDSVEC